MKGFALLLVLLPLAASAATITVNSTADNTTAGNGQCTLREAIANVNGAADTTGGDCPAGSGAGDTIKFAFAMPAKITLKLGALFLQRDVGIINAAPGTLRIDARRKSRVFEITAGTTNMSGLRIEHGGAENGGAILVDTGATLGLSHCVLAGNTASGSNFQYPFVRYGGGIFNAGTLTLASCLLTGNEVRSDHAENGAGGALHNDGGRVTMSDCSLTRNRVRIIHGDAFGMGGAISNLGGTVSLDNCRLTGNRAGGPTLAQQRTDEGGASFNTGGAIHNEEGSVTLTNCTLSGNRVVAPGDSESHGGAIYNGDAMTLVGCTLTHNVTLGRDYANSNGGAIDNEGAMILTSCTLAGNAARFASVRHGNFGSSLGGAIYNGEGDLDVANLTLTNCTLAGNQAAVDRSYGNQSAGGGLYNDAGSATLVNCTVSGNTLRGFPYNPEYGGYPDSGGGLAGTDATVINTIVAGSGAAGNCDVDMEIHSGGHNLSSDGSCFAGGGSDLLHTNPRLAPLRDNGGPTQTMALCTAGGQPAGCHVPSPAIDAGDDAVTGPPDNLSTDQRGLPRLSGAHVDIGAYEVQ